MKRKVLVTLLLSLIFTLSGWASQSGGYPDNYFEKVQEDLANVKTSSHLSLRETGGGTVTSMNIEQIDNSEFPKILLYVPIRDESGNHIEGLTADQFELYLKHELDSKPVGIKIDDFTLEEIGSVESKADIVFIIDSTGSMSGQIDTVKNNVIAFVDKLVDKNISFRLAGFDYGDEVPYRSFHPFDTNASTFKAWVGGLSANGGNDWPENPLDPIIAAGSLDYRPDAQQIIVLITDAPAHVAGDDGDSATTATFSAAASAIGDRTFYYFSDVTDYSVLGARLGGTNFDADTLINTLSETIAGKYLLSFVDRYKDRDGMKRTIRLIHTSSGVTTRGEYTVEAKKIPVHGTVTNNDANATPLPRSTVTAYNLKTKKSFTVATDDAGRYKMELIVGEYNVTASHIEYKTMDSPLSVKEDDKEKVLDFQLPRATIAEEKRRLIEVASRIRAFGTAFSSPYRDEAEKVIAWANGLPTVADGDGADPTDAEKEGLLRLIKASVILDKGNTYAEKDAEVLGQSVGEVIVSILTLTGKFDQLKAKIKALVAELPEEGSWLRRWAVRTVRKTFNFVADKLGELGVSIANTTLDFVAMRFPSDKYPIVSGIITITKDVIAASDGTPTFNGVVTSYITPWISKQIVIPFYTTKTETAWLSALDHSKNITTADFTRMATQLNDASKVLQEMIDDFNRLQKTYGSLGTIKNYITGIKNVLDTIHKIDPLIAAAERFAATASYAYTIDGTLKVIDKLLEGGNMIVSVTTGVYGGTHLYGLSDKTIHGMEAAYGGSMLRSYSLPLLTRTSHTPGAWAGYIDNENGKLSLRGIGACPKDSIAAFSVEVEKATSLLKENNLSGFGDQFVEGVGFAYNCVQESFDAMKAKVDAGAALPDYNRPINYDLLSEKAYNAYLETQNKTLGLMIQISSLIFEGAIDGEADGSFGKDAEQTRKNLQLLLEEWKSVVASSADTMANAVNSISGYLGSRPVVVLRGLRSSVDTITERTHSLTISATVANVGGADASNITLSLNLPKNVDLKALRSRNTLLFTRDLTLSVSPDLNQTIASVPAGTNVEVNWTVTFDTSKTLQKDIYSFVVSGDRSLLSGTKVLAIPAVPQDSDEDGLPDYWEKRYGLNPSDPADGLADDDGDGLDNRSEYLYGYDPTKIRTFGDVPDLADHLTIDTVENFMMGDLTGDMVIDKVDLTRAIQLWHKSASDEEFDNRADLNGNGYIDIEDLMRINAYAKAHVEEKK